MEALHAIGAHQTYAVLHEACEAFPGSFPSSAHDERSRQVDEFGFEVNEPFELLTDRFYDRTEDLDALLLQAWDRVQGKSKK